MSISAEGYHPYLHSVRTADRAQSRNLHLASAERDQDVPDLAREVLKINAKGKAEKRIYDLEGTGFHVETQIRLLVDNYKRGVPLSDSISQIEQDTNGFSTEYLKEAPVFGIPLELGRVHGEKRIVGRLYGKKLWLDSVDRIERDGVVYKSISELEKRAVTARAGTIFVVHSGEGWSGYQAKGKNLEKLDEEDVRQGRAREVTYPDAQTYVVRVDEGGGLTAVTLKAHMNLSQSERFMAALQGEKLPVASSQSEKERIKQIVGNVVEIKPEERKNMYDIVKTMKQIVGSESAYTDSMGRTRTFDEMRFMLANPENLEKLDEITQRLSDRFSRYAEWRLGINDEAQQSDLQIALGYTILNLMHEVRGPVAERVLERGSVYSVRHQDQKLLPFDPRATLEEMQKLPGCAGGGNSMKIDSASMRTGILGGDEHGSLQFECPDCGRTNTRKKGELLKQCQYETCKSTKVYCDDKTAGKRDNKPIPITRKQEKKAGQEERKAA